MTKTAGAKDKMKRVRRKSTEAEKNRRKEKKTRVEQRQAEQNKAAFIASLNGNKDENPSEQGESNHQQQEEPYVEIPVNDCNGCADLGSFVANIDDDTEEQDLDEMPESSGTDEEEAGVMKCYMKAIIMRFRSESSPSFLKDSEKETLWLTKFLSEHEYWIRSECARHVCTVAFRKLLRI